MKMKLALPLLAATLFASAVAEAAVGYTTSRETMRAGPGRDYPAIDTIGRQTRITVHGCIDRFDWCDVSRGRTRGWIDGSSLVIPYQGRRVRVMEYGPRLQLPTLTFSFDTYWDSHYRRAGFYRDRDSWRDRSRNWTGRRDQDRDGIPNAFDRDRDGDGVRNNVDNRPNIPNRAAQADQDRDGVPNARDRDRDGDGRPNNRDDSPNNPNRR